MNARVAEERVVDVAGEPAASGGQVVAMQWRPPVASETAGMLSLIERAARDPSVDIVKMRELLALRKEVAAEIAKQQFDDAMTACQAEIEPVRAAANNPQTKSRYAKYDALDRAIRPIYTRHGFSVDFDTGDAPSPDMVRVLCFVSRGGHTRTRKLDMPADGKGAKGGDVMTKTHATGAAITYGRRYLLGMAFNIAVTEDDDGNSASASGGAIGAEQLAQLREKIVKLGADIGATCDIAKIEKLEDLPAAKFQWLMTALDNWARGQQQKGARK